MRIPLSIVTHSTIRKPLLSHTFTSFFVHFTIAGLKLHLSQLKSNQSTNQLAIKSIN